MFVKDDESPGGDLFTRWEWDASAQADWHIEDGVLAWRDRSQPEHNGEAIIGRL
jgi:hypothetical protein